MSDGPLLLASVEGIGHSPITCLVAQMVKNLPAMQETQVRSLGWKIPWRKKWQPTLELLPGEFHGQRSLVGYCPWIHKQSDMTDRLTITCSFVISKPPEGGMKF